jgi:hypothetical protein
MPITATDDEMMRHQQTRDLGHPIDPKQPDAFPIADETEIDRMKSDKRASRSLGRDRYGRRRPGE